MAEPFTPTGKALAAEVRGATAVAIETEARPDDSVVGILVGPADGPAKLAVLTVLIHPGTEMPVPDGAVFEGWYESRSGDDIRISEPFRLDVERVLDSPREAPE